MDIRGLWQVMALIILNVSIAVILWILACFAPKERKSTYLMFGWFIFIVPVVGVLYILMGRLIAFFSRKKEVDMSDVSFSQGRDKSVLPPDKESELNYVPIEDAMAVSDTQSLRKLVLDTLRNNATKDISYLSTAMNSKDTETSHYAASIIMDALSECRTTSQTMIEQIQKNPEDVEINLLALEYIYKILESNIMNDIEQRTYVYIFDTVGENLFLYNLWYMSEKHYLYLTDVLISIQDYEKAKKWVDRGDLYRPNTLDTYKAKLHFYFESRDVESFFACLYQLKYTDILVDDEILNLFRIYNHNFY